MGIAPDGRISSRISHASDEARCLRRTGNQLLERWRCISTLDENIDAALGGGIAPGYVTEITGERYLHIFAGCDARFLLNISGANLLIMPAVSGRPSCC